MRTLICLSLVVFLFNTTEGWSLPPCPEDQNQRYHNCFGTLTYPSGNKYVGEWKDGLPNGQGTYLYSLPYTFASEAKYVGEFRDSKFHGQGTYTTFDGNTYVGGWRDGQRYGHGTFTWADGRVKEGLWENGTLKPE